MTNLYVLLIALGVLIIAAVFAYNWWQERKYHQQAEKNFTPLQSDALLDNPSFEVGNINTEASDGFEDTIIDEFSPKHKQNNPTLNVDEPTLETPLTQATENLSADDSARLTDTILPENVSINDAYSELTKARESALANQKLAQQKSAQRIAEDTMPVRRDDIKAIFDVAFGQANKPENAQNNPSSAAAPEVKQTNVNLPNSSTVTNRTPTNAPDAEVGIKTESQVLSLPAMLQSQMDLSVILHLSREIPASTLVSTLMGQFESYDKPVFLHTLTSNALALNQDVSPLWTLLKEVSPHQKVSKVACSIQLADRSGAISRNLLNRFQQAVNALGKQLNAQVAWQSEDDALTQANALDAFCIEVDKTIGFHLVHGEHGAFTGTKLKGLAEAQGFRLTSDGSFKYYDERGRASFIMFNRENFRFNAEMLRSSVVKGVTFQLDIPHVSEGVEAFNQMVHVAKQMDIGLHAALVDESNKVLTDAQIDKIRQDLKAIHSTMLARGIVPGSDSAIRLFS